MILFLWQLNVRRFKRYFYKKSAGKLITAGLFLLVFIAVAVGIYQFFSHGFTFLKNYPYFRAALLLYSFETFFLLIGFLVYAGSAISLLFNLFKSKRSAFIVSSPSFAILPRYTLMQNLLSSSWMLLFVLAPALLAGSVIFHTGSVAFITGILASIFVLFFCVTFAYITILGISYVWNFFDKRGPSFSGLAICVTVFILLIFGIVASKVSHHDILIILSSENLQLTQAPLAPVLQSFSNLPTSPAATIVTFSQTGQLQKTVPSFALIGLSVAIELLLVWLLSKKFLPLWQNLAENNTIHSTRKTTTPPKSLLLSSPFGAVLFKERIQLFRNPKNTFWLLFLLLLWISYIGFAFSIQKHLALDNNQLHSLPNIILALQLIVLVYFISALVLRFVFPSFSAERNTAWIFATSPLKLGRLLRAKFWFFTIVFGGFALLAEAINVLLLKLPVNQAGLFIVLGLITVATLCALGLFFGVVFANFETDDPQALGTSVPGLVFMMCAVLYGAAAAYAYFVFISKSTALPSILFIILSIIGSIALLTVASSTVTHTDFAPKND